MPAQAKAAADAAVCAALAAREDVARLTAPDGLHSPLAVYLAARDEITIDAYIERMLRAGVVVVAPRWDGSTYRLSRLAGLDGHSLRRGPMGIREPVGDDVVSPSAVRAWIVPGLAFTRSGRRLGYGGGWYDRLLAEAPPDAVKLGVAYPFQILADIPSEPHDILLTDVVVGLMVPGANGHEPCGIV